MLIKVSCWNECAIELTSLAVLGGQLVMGKGGHSGRTVNDG